MTRDITRAQRRKYHFIYRTTCNVTGRWYYGMHSTDNLEDGYLGSGTILSRSVKKYGRDAHTLEILEYCKCRKSLALRESEIINDAMLEEPLCMNLQRGGKGGTPGFLIDSDTRLRISQSNTIRWERDRKKMKESLDEVLANFTMTREEILSCLVQPSGILNKNATRALIKLQRGILAGQTKTKILATRERQVRAKWQFILSKLQNPKFKDHLVEQIDAYVYEREERPVCKMCSNDVTFFRFGQRYGIYCGASCQLKDPAQRNPVLSRWSHK